MGTIYASAIFTEVDGILLDTDKVRWTDAEKLRYLNAGQRQAVILKPDAYTVSTVYKLGAGTKQSVPDGTSAFADWNSVRVPQLSDAYTDDGSHLNQLGRIQAAKSFVKLLAAHR